MPSCRVLFITEVGYTHKLSASSIPPSVAIRRPGAAPGRLASEETRRQAIRANELVRRGL